MTAVLDKQQEEFFYRIALSYVPGIGTKTGRALLDKYSSAIDIFRASLKDLKHISGITEVKVKGFRDPEVMSKAEKEWEFVCKNNIKVICYLLDYPTRLLACADAPLLMYYKGTADLNAAKVVAIVGTRKNTDYGQKLCDELIDGLKSLEDVLVVSGLALGIDSIAHRRSLQIGIPTVGVLGHGHDRMYPFMHKQLAEEMEANGGVLTEFPIETIVDRNNFPMRNRIVAGLSDVTIVVESNVAGGALITAHMANGYNRDVAAYPGRVGDSRSAGCNELIRTNIAAMITKYDDLADLMNWSNNKQKPVQRQLFLNLAPEEQQIVDMLQGKDLVHADELYHHTGLANSQLAATLLQLEMQGLIKTLPGKYYRMS